MALDFCILDNPSAHIILSFLLNNDNKLGGRMVLSRTLQKYHGTQYTLIQHFLTDLCLCGSFLLAGRSPGSKLVDLESIRKCKYFNQTWRILIFNRPVTVLIVCPGGATNHRKYVTLY